MQLIEAIPLFKNHIIIQRGFSPRTANGYELDLKLFNDYLVKNRLTSTIQDITQDHILGFLAYLSINHDNKKANSVVTRCRKLASIRSFFNFLRKTHRIQVSPATDIDVPQIPYKESEYLSVDEYQKLLKAIDDNATPFFKKRDLAIFTMFIGTGLRVSELVGLKLSDVDRVSHSIKITRKGNRQQTLPLSKKVRQYLYDYLELRPKTTDDVVFISKQKQGIRANSAYMLVKKYLEVAGIHKRKQGCHLMRHTFMSALLAKNVNPFICQQLAGHKTFESTKRYMHTDNQQIIDAVSKIKI